MWCDTLIFTDVEPGGKGPASGAAVLSLTAVVERNPQPTRRTYD